MLWDTHAVTMVSLRWCLYTFSFISYFFGMFFFFWSVCNCFPCTRLWVASVSVLLGEMFDDAFRVYFTPSLMAEQVHTNSIRWLFLPSFFPCSLFYSGEWCKKCTNRYRKWYHTTARTPRMCMDNTSTPNFTLNKY